MPRHIITFEEMTEYMNQEAWHIAAGSWGTGSDKKLEVSSKGIFRVSTCNKVTYQGMSLGSAVDAYNEAP